MCDRVAVMYLGKIVETGPSDALYAFPRHPYTGALLSAVPIADPSRHGERRRLLTRRRAQPRQPAEGVPLPHPLPQGPGAVLGRGAADRGQGDGHLAACHFPLSREEARGDRAYDLRDEREPRRERAAPPEAEELLQALIRFNTVNPPGNERAAQEYLAAT